MAEEVTLEIRLNPLTSRQTNSYAAPVTESPLIVKLTCRLDAPSDMKGLPQAVPVHICRSEVLKRTLESLGSRQPENGEIL